MDVHSITDNYFVAPQINTSDVPAIIEAGFKTVICNRPDMEVPPSHQATAIGDALQAAGLNFHILPLTHQLMTEEVVLQQMVFSRLNGPILAYCATGTRCTVAWAIGSASEGEKIDVILSTAQSAGYELEGLRPTLEAISSKR